MPDQISATFFRDSHDRHGVERRVEWSALVQRCLRHDVGDKDGPALSCATFSGPRGNANLVNRTLVALDIEASGATGEIPLDVASMVAALAARRVECVLWTTHSHTLARPRYRLLLPLAEPIAYQPDIDPYIAASVAAELRVSGVADPSKFGAASLFYLPRHAPDAPHESHYIPGNVMSNGRLETAALIAAQGVAQSEAERAALRRANAMPPELLAKIERYNTTHPLTGELQRFGYIRDGMRWRSRYQHGQGATSVLPDGRVWTSFSESDAQAGVGQRPAKPSSQCACWGDSFALYVHYEHNNNSRAALSSIP